MTLCTTIHLHNVPESKQQAYADWFDTTHQQSLANLRGFLRADRYESTSEQIMPDIPQPWQFVSVYDFDLPKPSIDIPALGPLLADARDAGMISDNHTERVYSYELYGDWKFSDNHHADKPFSGVFIILANYVAGMFEEYQEWYENVHSIEVSECPGMVGMKRGQLAATQVEPRHYCPGDQLVMCAQQTDDLLFTIKDFSARARGVSPSGIAMAPRSKAGSFARTVHFFQKISGDRFWRDGVAYSGDLSVYEGAFKD